MAEAMKKTPEQRLADHKRMLKQVMAVALAVLAVVLIVYFSKFQGGLANTNDVWGQFGDFVGGILNPFFALCALFALLYTIVLQVEEMQDMRAEFTKTVDAAKHQAFENMFFQMLRLHHQIVDSMQVQGAIEAAYLIGGNPQYGRQAFTRLCELLDEDLNRLGFQFDDDGTNASMDLQLIHESWQEFFKANYPYLSHYFRNFYNILRYIDDSEEVDDKNRYTRILRAQLSAYELKLLFYDGLDPANKPLHKLAVEYALFEQIRVVPFSGAKFLEIRDNHFQFYDDKAYGDWTPPPTAYDAVSDAIDSLSPTAPESQSSE